MEEKTGVILLNMGGPEKLEDVAPFLYNLFSDRQIIQLGPRFLQKPLAWYIARKRAPKSRSTYSKIGGGSPLARITQQQADALELVLENYGNYSVETAMRYWKPRATQALQNLADKNVRNVIALPLYPHYSRATSGSSLADLKKAIESSSVDFNLTEIHGWPDNHHYIKCLAENILQGLASFSSDDVEILYSAHSLPVSFIEEGDPYLDQIQTSIAAIETVTQKKGRLAFQSRSGPVEWLSPSTPEMLERLAEEGCKNLIHHVETVKKAGAEILVARNQKAPYEYI